MRRNLCHLYGTPKKHQRDTNHGAAPFFSPLTSDVFTIRLNCSLRSLVTSNDRRQSSKVMLVKARSPKDHSSKKTKKKRLLIIGGRFYLNRCTSFFLLRFCYTAGILLSKPRSSLEAAQKQPRSSLEYGQSFFIFILSNYLEKSKFIYPAITNLNTSSS